MKSKFRVTGYFLLIVGGGFVSPVYADNTNTVEYSGTLVALPCNINAAFENMEVEIDTVVAKQLYLHGRTTGKVFGFEFTECDVSLGSAITMRFMGNSNAQGLLNFDVDSEATGAAIGIEGLNGEFLPLNPSQAYPAYPIEAGLTEVKFRAFVQGDRVALANQSIEPGPFTATLTYTLGYE